MRLFALSILLSLTLEGTAIRQASFSLDVDERSCSVRKPATTFRSTDRQVFFALTARSVAAGDSVRLEWIDPSNQVADTASYDALPAAPALCFVTQLPLAGFAAASRPGVWNMRVTINDREAGRYQFQITGEAATATVHVGSVAVRTIEGGMEVALDGRGFSAGSVVHVAEYKREGGWRYIHSVLPVSATGSKLTARIPALGPGEYIAIIRNQDDAISGPARFLVSTGGGYQMPLFAAERWMITQGPYGSFSHYNRSLHAFDLAPVNARWVAAMRGGVARTHDVGAVQSHTQRTFGNYITIDHGDGEYSHYAHLATRTFQVKDGERVQTGQALARVGNSGYTFGEGGGYHVHVHVTRSVSASSQSVPFQFTEFATLPATALKGRVVTSTATPAVAVAVARPPVGAVRQPGPGTRRSKGSVGVAGMWTDVVAVPPGARSLAIALSWIGPDRDLDLRVVSPGGRQFGALGERRGYSGEAGNPESLRIDNPEAGSWRVIAAGMKGGGEAMAFEVDSEVVRPEASVRRVAVRPRVGAPKPR